MIFGSSRMIKSAFTLVLVALQAVTIEADWGCYADQACDCSAAVCSEALCMAAGKTWAQGCNSCSCVCETTSTTYTATVDLFAGELGKKVLFFCVSNHISVLAHLTHGSIFFSF
jgi:hypothetical protein